MTVLRQAACVRFMRLHRIVQRNAREVGAQRAERAYFIFHLEYIYSALTGVDSMEVVRGDEEFPWKEKPRAESRGGLHRFNDIS